MSDAAGAAGNAPGVARAGAAAASDPAPEPIPAAAPGLSSSPGRSPSPRLPLLRPGKEGDIWGGLREEIMADALSNLRRGANP